MHGKIDYDTNVYANIMRMKILAAGSILFVETRPKSKRSRKWHINVKHHHLEATSCYSRCNPTYQHQKTNTNMTSGKSVHLFKQKLVNEVDMSTTCAEVSQNRGTHFRHHPFRTMVDFA